MPTSSFISETALITGISGQDGSYLAKRLLQQGYRVVGAFRRSSSFSLWRLEMLGIKEDVETVEFSVTEVGRIADILRTFKPSKIFHLAGYSYVQESFANPVVNFETNLIGTLNILEAMRKELPEARFFFASTSEIFGKPESSEALHELSPKKPVNPYGIAKLSAQNVVSLYREQFGLFATSGILFNHESPLRGAEFVTRKITSNLARWTVDKSLTFLLGNLDAQRDWGSAEDSVQAIDLMMSLRSPGEYVVATGKLTSVREFLLFAGEEVGIDIEFEGEGPEERCVDAGSGRIIAEVSPKYFREHETPPLMGCSRKLYEATKWAPSKSVRELAGEMIQSDLGNYVRSSINNEFG